MWAVSPAASGPYAKVGTQKLIRPWELHSSDSRRVVAPADTASCQACLGNDKLVSEMRGLRLSQGVVAVSGCACLSEWQGCKLCAWHLKFCTPRPPTLADAAAKDTFALQLGFTARDAVRNLLESRV